MPIAPPSSLRSRCRVQQLSQPPPAAPTPTPYPASAGEYQRCRVTCCRACDGHSLQCLHQSWNVVALCGAVAELVRAPFAPTEEGAVSGGQRARDSKRTLR